MGTTAISDRNQQNRSAQIYIDLQSKNKTGSHNWNIYLPDKKHLSGCWKSWSHVQRIQLHTNGKGWNKTGWILGKIFLQWNKKGYHPVKNAISFSISTGFIEGKNNKFKVLNRIVYGRSGLVNLEKKCKLAFLSKGQDFSLSALL